MRSFEKNKIYLMNLLFFMEVKRESPITLKSEKICFTFLNRTLSPRLY